MGGVVLFYKNLMGGVTGDVKPPFYRDHVLVCGMLGSVLLFFFRFASEFCIGFSARCIFWIEFFSGIRQFYEKSEKMEKVQLGR